VPQVWIRQAVVLLERAAKKIRRVVDMTQEDVPDSQPDAGGPVIDPHPPVAVPVPVVAAAPAPAPALSLSASSLSASSASDQTDVFVEPVGAIVYVLGPAITAFVIPASVHQDAHGYVARTDPAANFAAQVLTLLCEAEDQITKNRQLITTDEISHFCALRARYYPEINTDMATMASEIDWLRNHAPFAAAGWRGVLWNALSLL
jgi:hypothetical protein